MLSDAIVEPVRDLCQTIGEGLKEVERRLQQERKLRHEVQRLRRELTCLGIEHEHLSDDRLKHRVRGFCIEACVEFTVDGVLYAIQRHGTDAWRRQAELYHLKRCVEEGDSVG